MGVFGLHPSLENWAGQDQLRTMDQLEGVKMACTGQKPTSGGRRQGGLFVHKKSNIPLMNYENRGKLAGAGLASWGTETQLDTLFASRAHVWARG